MKLRRIRIVVATILSFAAGILLATAQSANTVTTAPTPDTTTHASEPLPGGILAWDALTKSVEATNEQEFARFTFSFTNITGSNITVLTVHPSCGCTTAELPPVPWLISAGAIGEIKISVNLQGKIGTLFKSVNVTTDRGNMNLMLRINILPPPPLPEMTEAQRAAGVAASKLDRQVVFKGDCAHCHLRKTEGKYGQQLFDAICAVCHAAKNRATMVPDLASLQVPTSEEFWRAWITAGKAGSLMPAFAISQGGPLNDLQIASLAAYLNAIHPSKVPPPTAK